jgi:hypothetical protein
MNLTPKLSSDYNPNVASNYSWVNVQNDQNRPLYAQASYITNLRDLNSRNGFVVIDDAIAHYGNYSSFRLLADSKFTSLSAENSIVGNISAYELPQGFELNGLINGFQLTYGAVIAYK